MTIDKKMIRGLAKEKICLGCTKQTVYTELNGEFHGGKVIADIIQSLPSGSALKKYKPLHICFMVFLFLLSTLFMVSFSFAGILWTVPMIVFTFLYKARYYGWACIAGLYGFLPAIQLFLTDPGSAGPGRYVFLIVLGTVIILISLAVAFLGFFLRSKLTPGYIEKKELYVNDEGEKRLRLVFEFKD